MWEEQYDSDRLISLAKQNVQSTEYAFATQPLISPPLFCTLSHNPGAPGSGNPPSKTQKDRSRKGEFTEAPRRPNTSIVFSSLGEMSRAWRGEEGSKSSPGAPDYHLL